MAELANVKTLFGQMRDRFRPGGLLWRLLSESVVGQRRKYIAAVVAMVLVAATTAGTAWIMGEIVDSMSQPGNRARVLLVAGAVALIFALKGVASYAQSALMARAGNRIVAQKQVELFRHLLGQGSAYFNKTESSDTLLRVTQSAQMARGVIDTIVTGFVRDLLTLIGLVSVMVYQQPLLSMVCLVVGPVAVWGVQLILKRVRAVMMLEMASLAEIIKVVQEASAGARVIKAYALEPMMADRMESAVRQVEKRANKIVRLESATSPLMDTITGLAIAAIVILSSVQVFGQSAGSPGQLMSFVTAFLMAYEPAKRISRMRVSIESGMVGVNMMYSLLDRPTTMVEAKNPIELPAGPSGLRLEDLRFSYTDGKTVIDGITVDFPQGKTTALVGPSGSGKSTLVNLILRLYEPDEGRILIDGIDMREVSFASLRRKISYVGQDTFLFSTTVMENLRMVRPDATDEQVIEAARVAHADEFIQNLANGFQTPIGENGAFLSGGQRQRIAIARAVLRDSPILLLDEATSALDSHSEALVRDALEQTTRNVTTIVVAHRLSTVIRADQICYIESGRIAEIGTLTDLLAKSGKFRALYEQQFAGS